MVKSGLGPWPSTLEKTEKLGERSASTKEKETVRGEPITKENRDRKPSDSPGTDIQ